MAESPSIFQKVPWDFQVSKVVSLSWHLISLNPGVVLHFWSCFWQPVTLYIYKYTHNDLYIYTYIYIYIYIYYIYIYICASASIKTGRGWAFRVHIAKDPSDFVFQSRQRWGKESAPTPVVAAETNEALWWAEGDRKTVAPAGARAQVFPQIALAIGVLTSSLGHKFFLF